ncbi:Thiamine monophosphate synthase/TENI [Enterovibrio nigricans DSM 22720]|uniref:Thiamine monophosphate synthase/TENI n=1 Tax=Enterovibrio nigricans DSM 22720 TaxID=1121868 RepID=A0A1T4WA45_9GAMM|nr:Thiamine monophosphate synthase/TENI [Enterovibrio nigricans DSM 22720]
MNPYRLYLVTDDQQDLDTLKKVVKEAVIGGVTMVQVREKHGDVRQFIERATAVKEILKGTGVPLIINEALLLKSMELNLEATI